MKGFTFPLTQRQKSLLESPARILVVGAGTKTGKSMALYVWLINGLLHGEPCCFVGPWFFRSRSAFDIIKNLLQPWILERTVKLNESRLQITAVGGGYIDFVSADNPDCLFGANYCRVVIDEASRCPEAIYGAALTTISATKGKARLAFNLDLGVRNWAIRHLLRIQSLSPEERTRTGEDCALFPSGGDGLVSDETIQQFKAQMVPQLFEALYLAKIPDSDCSLFRNLDAIFTGKKLEAPEEGKQYFMGVDLARKSDFTSLTVIDEDGNVVAHDRFTQMDWALQVGRAAMLYRTFKCRKAVVDASGIGDVIVQQFEALEMVVEPFIFTVPSRKALLEELVLACDNKEIRIPAGFLTYRQEMESFEYILDGGSIKYAAPTHMHDDTVMSLALAVHGFRAERGALLGAVLWMKRQAREIQEGIRDAFGELIRKPAAKLVPIVPRTEISPAKPVRMRAEGDRGERLSPEPCPLCKGPRVWHSGGRPGILVAHCNQCASNDGIAPPPVIPVGDACCGAPLQWVAGMRRCQNCGRQYFPGAPPSINGVGRGDYAAGVGRTRARF